MTADPEQFFADLTAAIGAPPLSAEELAAVLRLAKVVADASERRFAPLTCYAAGLVIGASTSEEDRLAGLRDLIDRVG
ncbi:MAG TPA: DUF6457 domain-containing protein [Acidimicrobiales bacterium]|nr:DUF6457 domain-containing protein [Acidimicrobiales bacterium]